MRGDAAPHAEGATGADNHMAQLRRFTKRIYVRLPGREAASAAGDLNKKIEEKGEVW